MFKLFLRARVRTMDPRRPRGQSLLTFADRVVAVFDEPDPDLTLPGAVERFDLGGRCLMPAFSDTHAHPLYWGLALGQLRLEEARSAPDVAQMVAEAARKTPPGRPILGAGWSANDWPADAPAPSAKMLDDAAPDHPVLLDSRCRHIAWANRAALALASVTRDTPDPAGGEIVRDATGEPSGLLRETAVDLLKDALPKPNLMERREALARAAAEASRNGVVSIHALSIRPEEALDEFGLLLDESREGRWPLRLLYYLPGERLDDIAALRLGATDPAGRVAIGGVKFFADGSLGGRTAWMRDPYIGEPENRGIPRLEPQELEEAVHRATDAGLGLAVHAIGDAAISMVLDAYEKGRAREAETRPGRRPVTYRIEHLQTVQREDIARCARLGVWAPMQPAHLLGDWKAADRFLGPDRAAMTFALRSILDVGVRVTFGSDAPIETASIPLALRAAVDRRGPGGPAQSWHPEQRIALEEALRAYTTSPAELAGDAHQRGMLRPGMAADLVILDRDPATLAPEELSDLRVEATFREGECLFGEEFLASRRKR